MRIRWRIVLLCTAWLCAAVAAVAQETPADPAADDDAPAEARAAIRQLGAPQFAEREAAVKRLLEIGPAAVPALREALQGDDPEVAFRAREALDLLALGVTGQTPEDLRRLAAGVLQEENPAVHQVALVKLARAGAAGWSILQHMQWCHGIDVGGNDNVMRAVLGGERQEVLENQQMERRLAYVSLRAGSAESPRPGWYVGTCLLQGQTARALARARGWYRLAPRGRTALLIARLHWAANRPEPATEWARRALEAPQDSPPDDARVRRGALTLLIAAGDLPAVADFCEQRARQADVDQLALLGTAALCAHLSDDPDRRDRNLEAMKEALAARQAADGANGELRMTISPTPCDYMVMCQLADRAVEFALEREDYARAALIRRYQGRPEEAERYMAKARGDDEDRMEMVEAGAPREKQTPVTRALDTARAADDPQKTRQALSDALGLLPANDARPATLRELYALLEEHGMAQERKSFEQMLLDPDSEHHAPGIVAAGRAENGPLAQAWHAVLLKTQPGWAPLRRVEHAVAIAEGKLDRDDLQQEMERAEQYAGENPGEGIVEYGRLANRWRPQPNEHVVAKVLDLLADTCLAYDMNVQAARYMTRADELAPDAGSRADQAAWVLVDAEKWTEAAQAFARAYENRSSSSPLFALRYYRGWCLERAGRQEEGRRQQRLAKVEARMSGSTLMRPLLRTYQLDAGLSEWRTARRIDPGGVPELVTVPLISEILDDYERAYADRRVQVLSHTLFGSNSYRPRWMMASASYLNTNRGLARLQAGEQVDIEALCDGYIQNTVAEPEGAILLVRGLDSLGHTEQADRVYAAAMEHARADLEENPEGDSARNMFTWLAGMCGRDLEEAIAVGEGLLEESPDSAPYLDTLGAAYYAHGDYEKAWRCEARAVKNGVSGWFYEAGKRLWLLQAARFRQAMERSAD